MAEHVGQWLQATVVVKDVVEAALWRRGVGREQGSFWASHELLTTLAAAELQRRRDVVLDTVATTEDVRADWRRLAVERGARFVVVVCVCSDEVEHRRRIDGRTRGIAGWPELSWEHVEGVKGRFEPWTDEHVVIDALDPVAANVERVLRHVR